MIYSNSPSSCYPPACCGFFMTHINVGAKAGQAGVILGFTQFSPPYFFIIYCSRAYVRTQRKRRPHVAYSQLEAFALPENQINNNETYADMINCSVINDKTGYYHTHRRSFVRVVSGSD